MKKLYFVIAILMAGFVNSCGGATNDSGASGSGNFTPLKSQILVDLYIDVSQEQWVLKDAYVMRFDEAVQIPSSTNGDHAVIVKSANGKIQHVSLLAYEPTSKAMAYDEKTGRFDEVDVANPSIQILRVPFDRATDSIVVEDIKGNQYALQENIQQQIPDEVFQKQSLAKDFLLKGKFKQGNLQDLSLNKDSLTPLELLSKTYPTVAFGRADSNDDIHFLKDNDLAAMLLIAMQKIPTTKVIHSMKTVSFVPGDSVYVEPKVKDGRIVLGRTDGQHIYLNEGYVKDQGAQGQEELNAILTHESAHTFSNMYKKGSYGDKWYDKWLDYLGINKFLKAAQDFLVFQEEFRELRSQSDCDEEYKEEEYQYEDEGGVGVSEYFRHGFATPYGSESVHEDFAEHYRYVLLKPDLVAAHWKQGNIYDIKISYFLELGMITDAIYENIKNLAQNNAELYTFEFRYRGVQTDPLDFVLNGHALESPFYGKGREIFYIDPGILLNQPEMNNLFLETAYDGWLTDYDDIEVADIIIKRNGPISPETGCESGDTVFKAEGAYHLGNDSCDGDQFCDDYGPLLGTEYEFIFSIP